MNADVAVIGGGVLGVGLAYFLARLNPRKKTIVIEREQEVARHASSRNTGKVHAPYLYDPQGKRIMARAAFMGFDMWKTYAGLVGERFVEDGVFEVACEEAESTTLEKYMRWGKANGLTSNDMTMLDGDDVRRREPGIRCHSAIFCSRDASVDYGALCRRLREDASAAGASFLLGSGVIGAGAGGDRVQVRLNNTATIHAKFVINAAGGRAVDIAHMLGVADDLVDVHFRGEYWKAPAEYNRIVSASVYSVPRFPEYPFLDPHWIVRADGSCEVGPNAVPVFGPYGYDTPGSVREFVPKMLGMLRTGAARVLFDPRFQALAASEVMSSFSRERMIGRVQRFMPDVDPSKFTQRGAAGIRSPVINSNGEFEPDVILREGQGSLSILNYNSPGATGALPFCAHVIHRLHEDGHLRYDTDNDECGPWRFSEIVSGMQDIMT